jgi:hypothetical protein
MTIACDGFSRSAGTPYPHTAIAVAGPPAGIPAVSTWGLVTILLMLATIGTVLIRRGQVTIEKEYRISTR